MDYKVEENRIIASDDQQPFVGEISFPKVTGVPDRVVVERVFVHTRLSWPRDCGRVGSSIR